jgi:predicted transcriptional regulator
MVERPETTPAGWAEALDEGLEDVRQGRVCPVSEVIAEIDAVLAEMDVTNGQ